MIKWLICMLWGHELDLNNSRIKRVWFFSGNGQPDKILPQHFCVRCQKYVTV